MDIARNSNDIVARHLAGAVPHEVLEVIGIRNAYVTRVLAADLPRVEVWQDFADILLELEDGRLLHLEVQTTREPNLYRFLHYDAAIAEKYRRKVRTVVLYTGNVQDAMEELDAGTIQYRVENVYLNRMDGDGALDTIIRHLAVDEWSETDRVRLAFTFHMRFEKRTRDEAFSEIVGLIQQLPDRREQNYIAALILGFSGRVLTSEQKERLKEVLGMTDLLRELLHDMEQEVREKALKEGLEQGLQQGLQQGLHQGLKQVAERMLRNGAALEYVVKMTGLPKSEVEEIQRNLSS